MKDIYWSVRRFIIDISWKIKQIKFFFQRGKRGWSEKDVWSIDYYLSEIIPQMIVHLRSISHGHPVDLSKEEWDKILEKIEQGFIASKRMQDFDGEYNMEKYKEDEKLFKEAMELFKEWYFDLWD